MRFVIIALILSVSIIHARELVKRSPRHVAKRQIGGVIPPNPDEEGNGEPGNAVPPPETEVLPGDDDEEPGNGEEEGRGEGDGEGNGNNGSGRGDGNNGIGRGDGNNGNGRGDGNNGNGRGNGGGDGDGRGDGHGHGMGHGSGPDGEMTKDDYFHMAEMKCHRHYKRFSQVVECVEQGLEKMHFKPCNHDDFHDHEHNETHHCFDLHGHFHPEHDHDDMYYHMHDHGEHLHDGHYHGGELQMRDYMEPETQTCDVEIPFFVCMLETLKQHCKDPNAEELIKDIKTELDRGLCVDHDHLDEPNPEGFHLFDMPPMTMAYVKQLKSYVGACMKCKSISFLDIHDDDVAAQVAISSFVHPRPCMKHDEDGPQRDGPRGRGPHPSHDEH